VQPGTNLPSALPGTDERARIEQHFQAQEKAQAAGDLFAAQLLGAEFPVLLAAFHGDVMLTDLIARALAQQTLVLRLYGRFPPTPWDVDAQRDLALAIVARRGEDAIALFKARHAELFDKLWFGDTAPQGDEDLASLLAERTADPPGLPHKAHPHTTGIRTEP
jgi:DNA-binding GntR family transcriptional regulator